MEMNSTTAANVALGTLQGTGAAIGAYSAYSSAAQARRAAKLDAAMLDLQAADTRERANTAAARVQAQGQRGAARVRAQAAGSGFTAGAGTAADIEGAAEFIAGLDAAAIRESGRREALGIETQSEFRRAEGQSVSPWASAAGTLIGSAAQVGGYWHNRRNPPKPEK